MAITFKTGNGTIKAKNLVTLMEKVERHVLLAVIRSQVGNVTHAAAVLGIDRSSVYRKMHQHGIILKR